MTLRVNLRIFMGNLGRVFYTTDEELSSDLLEDILKREIDFGAWILKIDIICPAHLKRAFCLKSVFNKFVYQTSPQVGIMPIQF